MNFDRNALLAILACILFYIIYSQYLASKYPPPPRRTASNAPTTTPPAATSNTPSATDEQQQQQQLTTTPAQPRNYQTLTPAQQNFSNDEIVWQFDQRLGGFTSIELQDYREGVAPDAAQINLVQDPLFIQGQVNARARRARTHLHARREGRTLITWYEQDGWRITHEFGFPEQGYGLDMLLRFKNITKQDRELQAALLFAQRVNYGEQSSSFIPVIPLERTQIITKLRNEVDWQDLQGYCDDNDEDMRTPNSQLDLFGLDRHYFLSVLLTDLTGANFTAEPLTRERRACSIALLAWQKQGLVAARQQVSLPLRAYFGPKVLEDMESYDQRLAGTLDLGWFGAISLPLLAIIKWLYKFVSNYGIAIIILTVMIKILFYPLTRSSVRSMQGMKKLQPQMNNIRARYKDDPKRQQQELMKFMTREQGQSDEGLFAYFATDSCVFCFLSCVVYFY